MLREPEARAMSVSAANVFLAFQRKQEGFLSRDGVVGVGTSERGEEGRGEWNPELRSPSSSQLRSETGCPGSRSRNWFSDPGFLLQPPRQD